MDCAVQRWSVEHTLKNQSPFICNQPAELVDTQVALGQPLAAQIVQVSYPSGQQVQVCAGQSYLTLFASETAVYLQAACWEQPLAQASS